MNAVNNGVLILKTAMFNQAIVKIPAQSMVAGITHAGLGLPNHELALQQHQNYISAL